MTTVYRFRLKDPATSEFRQVSVAADSEAEAAAIVEAREQKQVHFNIVDPDELKLLEKLEKDGLLRGREKGRLYAHRQGQPYLIQKGGKD